MEIRGRAFVTFRFLGASAWQRLQKTKLEKTSKSIGRASTFSMCAFLRAAPKRQAEDKGGEEKRSQNRGEKGRRSNANKNIKHDQHLSHFGCKNRAKTSPEAASDAKLAPRAFWKALGLDFGVSGDLFGSQNRSKNASNFKDNF